MKDIKVRRENEKIYFLVDTWVKIYREEDGKFLGQQGGGVDLADFKPADKWDRQLYYRFLQFEENEMCNWILKERLKLVQKIVENIPKKDSFQITLPYRGVISSIKKIKIDNVWVLYSWESCWTHSNGLDEVAVLWVGRQEPKISCSYCGNVENYSRGTIVIKKELRPSNRLLVAEVDQKLKRKTRDMLNKCKNPALIRKIYILLNSQS